MKTYCIYCHTNKINNKKYIGQTCQSPEKRWKMGRGYVNCPRFYSAIQHYGWENFKHEILETGLTAEEANSREQFYINLFQTQDINKGYNMTCGGNTLITYYKDNEHKYEQSLKRKQYFIEHPEKRIEQKERLKEISIRTAHQRSEKMKDNYNNKGGLYELNQKRKKKIRCVETCEIFDSMTEASKKYNISTGNISMVINGKRKIAGGYHWEIV